MATPVTALVLGCLLQGPWNSLPVIDCNTGPRLYGAQVTLKDGRKLSGYVAMADPLPAHRAGLKVALFKPGCGLTLFERLDVRTDNAPPPDGCVFDEFPTQHFTRAWVLSKDVLDLPAPRLAKAALVPGPWDGLSTERFLILTPGERAVLEHAGPQIPVDDYQGSGRIELRGGAGVKEDALWDLAPAVAKAVTKGGRKALVAWKAKLLKKKIALLFYPDVEP